MTETVQNSNGDILAYYYKNCGENIKSSTFITPNECGQQVGFITLSPDRPIKTHIHKEIKREIIKTTEVLYVLSGKCYIRFYNKDCSFRSSLLLEKNDLIVIVDGAHSLKTDQNTVLLEVKQGPYYGPSEKEFIDDTSQQSII